MAADNSLLLGLVEEFVSGQVDSKATETASGVKTGQFTILQLVEALGLSLTSSQPHTRGRGVQLLSQVLQECYSCLSEREVEVLIAFYENRLKDHYVITPHVLQGLKALTKCSVLPPGSAVSILRSIFQDVHVQSLMLAERSCVYNILISLMESREEELKGLGADFTFGFVQSVDGERDPRNLLLAFQVARNIIHRGYDLGKFVEELFEVTSCYFPIDFSPPPNDPHGITQEDLILSLRNVLTGTSRFAEFLLPLIIEKLDSDVQSAKVDSLLTLAACGLTYSHKELAEFLPGLWSSIRREVFQTASERVESAGLSALGALTSSLSRSVLSSDSEDSLQVFLNLVLKDCQHHLCEPDLKLVWPSTKLLQAAAGASYRASLIVSATVIPALLEQYNNRTQCAQRRTLLEVLQGFVQPTPLSRPADGVESVLVAFQQSLCSVVFSALAESSAGLQVTATRVLTALGQQPCLLAQADVEKAVDHLTRLILEEEDTQVSSAVVECSGSLAHLHPKAFISRMIPRLKEEILSESNAAVRLRCVTAVASVSSQLSVVQESTPVLLQVLASAHTGSCSFSVEEVSAVCISLQRIAAHARDTEEIGRFFHSNIIPRLLGLALQAALQSRDSGHSSPLTDEAVLSALVPVISTACAALQSESASRMAAQAVSLFLDGDVSFLPENAFPSQIQLLQSQAECRGPSQLVCLLMACVCSLPRSVDVPEIDRLLVQLEDLICTCSHLFCYTFAAKCFAGLVNKRPAGEALDAVLERVLKRINVELENGSSSQRTQAFTLLLWVAKALLLRYHPLSTALTDKLFALLSDPELGSQAADGFCVLMSDSPDVLNRSCHADVRIMYRQRFFAENSSKLVEGFNSAEQEKKSCYLKALSHIVNNLPREVQLTELPALLPLLLEALSCPDREVQFSTLSCMQPVLLEPPEALRNQLEALFSRMLALTTSPDMKVRIASIRCVHALSRLPEHVILPFRARVLKALAVCLDDRKRLVRNEAVAARGQWFLLGSPGGK
ncbi:MMS19 nucleotide excision repair protein homolog isoform X2 [Rhinichthys klamathensis goyatoka]|uniref:MMS19 nucleotide excision repair protein homolog isoform X2 n=1 Tax=Rhinichthys klamathensis goyatoka TaxID=3034132 RepID=UPI0024B5F0A5|nr:MMS19 nucleotide excision repair protein homolog isoform X2 [Rhinichthys klamathensis goyatoka]